MTADTPKDDQDQITSQGPPPVRTLAFSMLSLLVEVAAARVGARVPTAGDAPSANESDHSDINEARLAIDAANALLGAVGRTLQKEERLAIEGMLTQLQVEYVKRLSEARRG